jgi:hypothetical protein
MVTFYELDGPKPKHYDDGNNSRLRERYSEELLHIHCFVRMIRIPSLLKDINYME